MNNLAPYNPLYVTIDYACQYLRAKHDSRITASVFDPVTQVLTTDVSGNADIATQFFVFTGSGGLVLQGTGGVPPFSGTTRVTQQLTTGPAPSLTALSVSPVNGTITVGATQQFTATGSYSDGTTQDLTGQVTWTSSIGTVATISTAGRATALAAGTTTISAGLSGITGSTTLTAQAAPLTIVTASLPGGTLGLPYVATLGASGGAPPYSWSLSSGTLPAGLVLSAAGVISGTPTAVGTSTFTVTVTDSAAGATSATWSIPVLSSSGLSIWPASAAPALPDRGPDSAIELGVKFRSDVSGSITGIRFYKSATNTGTHVGNLWASTGALLATATFAGEGASGWQQVNFATPVPVSANTTYIASYHTRRGSLRQGPQLLQPSRVSTTDRSTRSRPGCPAATASSPTARRASSRPTRRSTATTGSTSSSTPGSSQRCRRSRSPR